MSDRNKDMTGVLFRNDRKGNPSQPDRKGKALIDGKPYYVAGWLKEGKSGQFLSLAFTPTDDAKPAKRDSGRAEDIESDIPF